MNSTETTLLAHVAGLKENQLAWTRELIAIPTVNPYSGDDSAGSEEAGQAWIEQRMSEMGAEVSRVAVPADVYEQGGAIGLKDRVWEGRENVVGRWTLGTGDGPTILINNHMDTVGTDGMSINPFDPVVKDGRIYGRGASDTKGNTAMGLVAIQSLLQCNEGLNGRLIFESVVDEECNGAGAGTLACCLAGIRGDVAIVLDGAAGRVLNGCNGIATAKLIVRGRAGHNAMGNSINAIDKAFVVKQTIDRFAQELLSNYPMCRINIGVMRAGTLPSIVPGQAELQVNMSYPVQDALAGEQSTGRWGGEVFRARFEHAIAALADEDSWFREKPVEVSWIKDSYPYQWDENDPALLTAAAAASLVHGKEIQIGPMPAWFDGAHLARQLNIPTFSLGHGVPGAAHTPDEYAVLDDLYHGAQTVALTLHRLLAKGV